MHDITELEVRGIPGVGVATTEFIDAADTQTKQLGIDVKRVFVTHPIQDRTDDEVKALADQYFDEIVAGLTAS